MVSISALESPIRQQIIHTMLTKGGIITYDQAKKDIKTIEGRLDYHLTHLVTENLLERVKRGTYRIAPSNIQILREHFDIISPIALIGGLGQNYSLLTDLSQALREVSIVPLFRVIITSPEIAQDIRNDSLINQSQLEIISLDYQTILRGNPLKIESYIDEWFLENYLKYSIVVDLTGGTKPATIALHDLAKKYRWKVVYFSSQDLIWL